MNTLELLRDLFRHMEWADAVVWRAVLASASAAADPAMKSKLHHLHMVQRAFLNVWREMPHTRNDGSELSVEELARWARDYYGPAWEYLDTVSEWQLDKPVSLPWARMLTSDLGREPSVPSLGETMMQIAAHSTYHRGQINARLRELGDVPPLTDFIAWIWLGKPAAEWPADAEAVGSDQEAG
jgi:uncharacterized damage-inducible protein DinB